MESLGQISRPSWTWSLHTPGFGSFVCLLEQQPHAAVFHVSERMTDRGGDPVVTMWFGDDTAKRWDVLNEPQCSPTRLS